MPNPKTLPAFLPGIVLTTLQRVSIEGTEEAQGCIRAVEHLPRVAETLGSMHSTPVKRTEEL